MRVKKLLVPCLLTSVFIPSFSSFAMQPMGIDDPKPVGCCYKGPTISFAEEDQPWSTGKKVTVGAVALLSGSTAVAAGVLGYHFTKPADFSLSQTNNTLQNATTTFFEDTPQVDHAQTTLLNCSTFLSQENALLEDIRPDFFDWFSQERGLSRPTSCQGMDVDGHMRSMFFAEQLRDLLGANVTQPSAESLLLDSCRIYKSGNENRRYIITFEGGRPTLPGWGPPVINAALGALDLPNDGRLANSIPAIEKYFLNNDRACIQDYFQNVGFGPGTLQADNARADGLFDSGNHTLKEAYRGCFLKQSLGKKGQPTEGDSLTLWARLYARQVGVDAALYRNATLGNIAFLTAFLKALNIFVGACGDNCSAEALVEQKKTTLLDYLFNRDRLYIQDYARDYVRSLDAAVTTALPAGRRQERAAELGKASNTDRLGAMWLDAVAANRPGKVAHEERAHLKKNYEASKKREENPSLWRRFWKAGVS